MVDRPESRRRPLPLVKSPAASEDGGCIRLVRLVGEPCVGSPETEEPASRRFA
jgi:hypothetical protein